MDVHPCSDDQVVVLVSLLSSGKCGAAVSDQEQRRCADGELDETTANLNDEIHFCKDLLDNATLPMLSVSCKGDILWANTAMVNMMGYSSCPHEFVGSVASKHHVDREQRSEMFNKILQGHPQVDFECKLKHRSGSVIVVNYSSNAKFDSDGKFVHSRCIVRQAKKHSELRSERDEMQKKQLSAEIKEREAVAASKTKSEFLAVMSHELRTPINGVLGATSLLGITSLNDEQRDYVNTITDSADILLSLISNILDISKIENGKFELEKVPLRLVDMVRKCADLMKYRAYEKGLTITTEIDSTLDDASVWHRGDPTRLNQVLLNFVSNAVKFTNSGGVTCKLMQLQPCGTDETVAIGDKSTLSSSPLSIVARTSSLDTYSCRSSSCLSNRTDGSAHSTYDWLRIEVTDIYRMWYC
jgi:PAS domain S-box-containing protein